MKNEKAQKVKKENNTKRENMEAKNEGEKRIQTQQSKRESD
jgi:hypothetical protein